MWNQTPAEVNPGLISGFAYSLRAVDYWNMTITDLGTADGAELARLAPPQGANDRYVMEITRDGAT